MLPNHINDGTKPEILPLKQIPVFFKASYSVSVKLC